MFDTVWERNEAEKSLASTRGYSLTNTLKSIMNSFKKRFKKPSQSPCLELDYKSVGRY